MFATWSRRFAPLGGAGAAAAEGVAMALAPGLVGPGVRCGASPWRRVLADGAYRAGSGTEPALWDTAGFVGAWRSLVARTVRVGEVPGSNPGAPIRGLLVGGGGGGGPRARGLALDQHSRGPSSGALVSRREAISGWTAHETAHAGGRGRWRRTSCTGTGLFSMAARRRIRASPARAGTLAALVVPIGA